MIRGMAEGRTPVSHGGLDSYPSTRQREFLRDMLISAGVLKPVPRKLHTLLEWIDRFLDTVDSPDRQVLVVYARWTITRRLRASASRGSDLSEAVLRNTRSHLHVLNSFLTWLAQRGISLNEARQSDVDEFLADCPGSIRYLPQFLTWAGEAGYCGPLTAPTYRSSEPAAPDADDAHWAIVEHLLADDSVRVDTRVSGLFVLLYGQRLSHICRLTRDRVEILDDRVTIRFAADPIEAPPGLDDLLRRHIRALDQHPNTRVSPWLFPGRLPTQPIGPGGLGVRLKQIGIATRTVRTTALIELAAQLPAAVLADFIGIHPETAVTWSKIAGRDWNAYPALRQQSNHE